MNKSPMCLIHVGMHKTGTTSLQRTLSRANLPGWHYLNLNGHIAAIPFFAMFGSNADQWHWYKKKGWSREEITKQGARWRKDLTKILNGLKGKGLIISGEAIPFIDEEGIRRMKEFLEPYFERVTVVGYVRAPRGFLNSMLQQDIKAGAKSLRLRPIQYRERFEKLDNVFGRENVQLWKFDPKAFPGNCLVTDFCERTGIPLPENSVVRVNESLSREACGFLLAYRKYGRGYGVGKTAMRENDAIVDALYEVQGEKFHLGAELIEPTVTELGEDVQWMEARLGQSLNDNVSAGAGAIHSEAELLCVSAKICQVFAVAYNKITGMNVSHYFPAEGVVEPRTIGEIVDKCRDAHREQLLNSPSPTTGKGQNVGLSEDNKGSARRLDIEVADIVRGVAPVLGFDERSMSKADAKELVEGVLLYLRGKIENAKEGDVLSVGSLGKFRVKGRHDVNSSEGVVPLKVLFTPMTKC